MIFTFVLFSFNKEIKSIKEELATRLNSSETSDLLKEKDEQIRGLMEEGTYLIDYEKYCKNRKNTCHITSCGFLIKNIGGKEVLGLTLSNSRWQFVKEWGARYIEAERDTCM